MTSNSSTMTVAERLAQRLKESDMGSLLDEDSVTEIAQEALRKAFFQQRMIPSPHSYGNSTIADPLIVEMARSSFKQALDIAIKPVVEALVSDDEFKLLIRQGVIDAIPETAREIGTNIVNRAMMESYDMAMGNLRGSVGAKLGIAL